MSRTTLAPRRFPDRITRLRQMEGTVNKAGEWEPGAVIETVFAASVQPIKVEDVDAVEGARLSERLKVYLPIADALMAAGETFEADLVRWKGRTYTVIESRSWERGHCRATLLTKDDTVGLTELDC